MTENLTTSGETPKVKTALLDAYKTKEEIKETRLDADEVSNNKPLLEKLPKEQERVFPVTDVAVRQAWDRLRRRAGITDLTFHDLRHEAISRQFESGLSIPQVMAISGHQTASQLFRYVNLSETDPVNM